MAEVPLPRPRPDTFDKAKESFSSDNPDCPTGNCDQDECEKCRQSMIKALKGQEFEGGINGKSSQELSDASITTFGELSAREAKGADAIATQQRESQAIAAMLYNRSNAVSSGNIPRGSNFGRSGSLSGVASARGQFHGYSGGKKLLDELTKKPLKGEACRRQCQRWKASKAAVEKFAKDPAALDQFNQQNGTFYYNRAIRQGNFTRTMAPGEVRIGGNDFSEVPMGTDRK